MTHQTLIYKEHQNHCTLTSTPSSPVHSNKASVESSSLAVELDHKRASRESAYRRQDIAREILGPEHRISKCLRLRAPFTQSKIKICRNSESNQMYYKGLMKCGSIWACPVCARKAAEERRQRILPLVQGWTQQGQRILLLTLTIPHTLTDDLTVLTDTLQKAYEKLWTTTMWKKLKAELGYIGQVRCLEVTYGTKNGYHPHIHALLFIQNMECLESLKQKLFDEWVKLLAKVGWDRPPSIDAISLQDGKNASNYLTKWGLTEEVTKASSKTANNDNHSPFTLLDAFAEGEIWAAEIFKEYVRGFKGRRQLVVSRGLEEKISSGLVGGPENAEETHLVLGFKEEEICTVEYETWKLVRAFNLRSFLLDIAELYGAKGVEIFTLWLLNQEPRRLISWIYTQDHRNLALNIVFQNLLKDAV